MTNSKTHTSKPGNSVYTEFGIWLDTKNPGHIRLTATGVHGFHSTVCADPASWRGHPNLFMKLAKKGKGCTVSYAARSDVPPFECCLLALLVLVGTRVS